MLLWRGGCGTSCVALRQMQKSRTARHANAAAQTTSLVAFVEKVPETFRFVLCAHSFGGYISTALCNDPRVRPRVASLVLLSPCLGFPQERKPTEEETQNGWKRYIIDYAFDKFESQGGVVRTLRNWGSAGHFLAKKFIAAKFAVKEGGSSSPRSLR